MSINVIVLGVLALIIGGYAWKAWWLSTDTHGPNFLPFTPIDVRKTKVYVSQTRDASMWSERVRRTAIISNPDLKVGYKGSTNGSLEWNFLTGICVCPPRGQKVCPAIYELEDGGYYDADVCDVLDGMGTDVADFGDAFTETCAGVCPPFIYETQEGGNVNSDVCNVFDGEGTDLADFGGAVQPNVC